MTLFDSPETTDDPAEHSKVTLTADELAALDGRSDAPTADLNADDLAALANIPRPDLGPRWSDTVARPAAPRTEPEPGTYIVRILDSRPSWHAISTPVPVAEAGSAIETAMAADRGARAEFAELPAREAAERRAIGEAAVAGDEIPALTDWSREKLILLAKHAQLAERVKSAAKAYDVAVETALPAWRDELVSSVELARQEALSAFEGVQPAVRAWLDAKAAAYAVDSELHRDDVLPTTLDSKSREIAVRGENAAAALSALLHSDHPVISGEFLHREDKLRPPMWVREALNETASGASQLESIEIRERFRHTSFTKHDRNAHFDWRNSIAESNSNSEAHSDIVSL